MTSEAPSASYSAIMNSSGELLLGVGDMDIHDHITPDYVSYFEYSPTLSPHSALFV